MKLTALLALILAAVTSSFSQAPAATPTPNPLASTIRDMEQRQSKNLIAAAEEMPADKYGYKPTPEQMSFAHLVVHIAESNNALCSKLGPEKQKVEFTGKEGKEELLRDLKDSFFFCKKVLDSTTDGNLAEPMQIFEGRSGTRATVLVMLATGWADHYSAAAMYLRLNGLLPPTAKK